MVFVDYEKFENFMKIYAKIDPKSDPKIDVWALRGPTFEVFGNISRTAIFLSFLKIKTKKRKSFQSYAIRYAWNI